MRPCIVSSPGCRRSPARLCGRPDTLCRIHRETFASSALHHDSQSATGHRLLSSSVLGRGLIRRTRRARRTPCTQRSNDETGLWALQVLLRFRSIICDGRRAPPSCWPRRRWHRRDAALRERVRLRRTLADHRLGAPCGPSAARHRRLHDGRFLLLGKVNHEKALVLASNAERPTVITRAEFEAAMGRPACLV